MPAPDREERQRQKADLEARYRAKVERLRGGAKKTPDQQQQQQQQQQQHQQQPLLQASAYLPPPETLSLQLSGELAPQEQLRGFAHIGHQMKKNPLVPAGMLVTVFALGNGLRYMVKRKHGSQQHMMRLRVFGQGFTMLALVFGTVLLAARK